MLPWMIVASGLVSLFFWKKANPGKSLNPFPVAPDVSDTKPRTSAKP